MKVTPLDIRRKEFKRSMRGYADEEVDIFLDEVADEFERVFQENAELHDRLERQEDQLQSHAQIKSALEKTLVSAQLQADQMTANARKEAELVMRDAELQSRKIVAESYAETQRVQQALVQLKHLEEDFRYKFQSLLEAHLKLLNEAAPLGIPEASPSQTVAAETERSTADSAALESAESAERAEPAESAQPPQSAQPGPDSQIQAELKPEPGLQRQADLVPPPYEDESPPEAGGLVAADRSRMEPETPAELENSEPPEGLEELLAASAAERLDISEPPAFTWSQPDEDRIQWPEAEDQVEVEPDNDERQDEVEGQLRASSVEAPRGDDLLDDVPTQETEPPDQEDGEPFAEADRTQKQPGPESRQSEGSWATSEDEDDEVRDFFFGKQIGDADDSFVTSETEGKDKTRDFEW